MRTKSLPAPVWHRMPQTGVFIPVIVFVIRQQEHRATFSGRPVLLLSVLLTAVLQLKSAVAWPRWSAAASMLLPALSAGIV